MWEIPGGAAGPGDMCPANGIVPQLGFSPTMPQKWAGTRIDPP